jgi:NADH-quinone oxidoreductase subunit K
VTPVGLPEYLAVSAVLVALGAFTVVTRRNALGAVLGVQLVLGAAALGFAAFDHFGGEGAGMASGQVFALFILVLGAAEAAVLLAVALVALRARRTLATDTYTLLRR